MDKDSHGRDELRTGLDTGDASNRETEEAVPRLFRLERADQGRLEGAASSRASQHTGAKPHVARKGRERLLARARETMARRTRRGLNFSNAMFGEPAWDMLLALYTAEASAAAITVTGLTKLSGAPPTTALRWLDYLAKERMVMREPHLIDRRLTYVSLTDKGRQALDAYFDEPSGPASDQHCE